MRKILLFLFILPFLLNGQTGNWKRNIDLDKAFIKNEGQFEGRNWQKNNQIEYAVSQNPFYIFFTKKGLTYRLDKIVRNPNRKKGKHDSPKRVNISELIHVTWLGANENVEIVVENKTDHYFSYAVKNFKTKEVTNLNRIGGYKKIIYKNLYDRIDIEYVFHPEGGIKYSVILHPGADPSQIKMQYKTSHTNTKEENITLKLNQLGQIEINTSLGDIIEHKPYTFYNNSKGEINSKYVFENNVLSFEIENYDNSQKIVIDPWVVSPTYTTSTAVWEVETDGLGNVYVIGGETPMELKKYDSAGNPLWTYTTPWDTASVWLGTLATDASGTSFITSGTSPEIERVDNAGNMVWHTNGTGFSDEYWSITFNCDKTKLIVGGTSVSGLFDFYATIFDIDINSGNVLNTATFAYSNFFGGGLVTPEEVRSISSSKNARYIFLTHDQVGAVNQNLGICPTDDPVFQVNNTHNLGYKCENYLPKTQNGGGLKALVANDNYFYTHAGDIIYQWDLNTGAQLNNVNLPGGSAVVVFGGIVVHNSGLAVDDCGDVYAGSMNSVVRFDQNLNIKSQSSVSFTVYDLSVNSNGEVLAVGAQSNNSSINRNGRIESINMSACAQYALVCCDANVCMPGTMCITDAPITLTPNTGGGTWSGTGVNASGVFDPAGAGLGIHTITYTLACGPGIINITVSPCVALNICVEANNDLTVSGGVGPYTWLQPSWTQDCSGCFPPAPPLIPPCSLPPGCAVNVLSWTSFGTGTTVTPYAGADTVAVVSGTGDTTFVYDITTLSACSACSITATSASTNENCGQSDGAATVTPSGGATPFSYSWSNGQTGATATGLSAGIYYVTVSDGSSCTVVDSAVVSVIAAFSVITDSTNATCANADGTATITPSGGATPFSYSWDNGQTGATATGLSAGIYLVTVTDNNSCPLVDSVEVNTTIPSISATLDSTDASCGVSDGTATVAALSGGASPYTYLWDGAASNQTDSIATGLAAGSYSVTVTDNNGCAQSFSVTVNSVGGGTVTIAGTDVSCSGANDGSAAVTASGGTSPYSYSWSDGQTGSTATGLSAGTITVTVTDAGGCSIVDSVTVYDSSPIIVSITGSTLICAGDAAILTASSGSSVNTYSWSTGDTDSIINVTPVVTTTYQITVTDTAGCFVQDSITITVSPTPSVAGATAICEGGSANLSALGGGTYQWSTGEITDSIVVSPSSNTIYVVIITNSCGSFVDSVQVSVYQSASVDAGNDTTILLGGSAQLSASGGVTYLWEPDDGSLNCIDCENPIAMPSSTTTYSVTVTDINGCIGTNEVTVTVDESEIVYLPNIFSPNNDNENDVLWVRGAGIKELRLMIFDRWGEKVYDSEMIVWTGDKTIGWDGTFRGKVMNPAVFVYVLEGEFLSGNLFEEDKRKGNVTLVK
ncbi:gliding motility-associated C-terminal domain-containing protein [Bacteroidales bacterium AH-315-I05]|nr:gliding motility-associated C-terminal domain-containing protein [Bacteroidales bacterium AH-315-I05]